VKRLPRSFADCLAGRDDRAADWQWRRDQRTAARYRQAVVQKFVPERGDGDAAGQVERYCEASRHQRVVEELVRGVLDAHGVRPILYLAYYNYARKLDKHRRHHGFATLRQLAAIAFDEARARGLDPAVLTAIHDRLSGKGQPATGGKTG